MCKNIDEAYFVINMDNSCTLGFHGDEEMKYDDIILGGMGMTMVVKMIGGVYGKIALLFMIFQNTSNLTADSYLIYNCLTMCLVCATAQPRKIS